MTVGLLGGTFDPIHLGHLDVAIAAQRALRLERVWVAPAHVPPHRASPAVPAAHRFAMAALAIEDQPGLLLSDVDMETTGPSYTMETLDRLERRGLPVRTLCFITGADAFRDIGAWKGFPDLLDRCHFVVVSRPGAPAPALRQALPALAPRMVDSPADLPAQPHVILLDAPTAPVSSTVVREAAAAGRPLEGLVPNRVAAYIHRHGLYRPRHDRPVFTEGVS